MIQPHTVTVIEPTTSTDSRGDQTINYGSGSDVAGWMQQVTQTELLGERDQRSSDWTLFSTETPDLTSLARIVWDGRTFQVSGEPNHLWNPNGYHHTEANLTLVEG